MTDISTATPNQTVLEWSELLLGSAGRSIVESGTTDGGSVSALLSLAVYLAPISMILCVIVLVWRLVSSVLYSAQTGKVAEAGTSNYIIKAVIAVALVTPTPVPGGLSLAHIAAIGTVGLGMRFTEYVWNSAQEGTNGLFQSPIINTYTSNTQIVYDRLLLAQTCAMSIATSHNSYDNPGSQPVIISTTASGVIQFGENGRCGSISLPQGNPEYDSIRPQINAALRDLISASGSLSQAIVTHERSGALTEYNLPEFDSYLSTAKSSQATTATAISSAVASGGQEIINNKTTNQSVLERLGWIGAGATLREINRKQTELRAIVNSLITGTSFNEPTGVDFESDLLVSPKHNIDFAQLLIARKNSAAFSSVNSASETGTVTEFSFADACSLTSCSFERAENSVAMYLAGAILGDAVKNVELGADPVAVISSFGNNMITAGLVLYAGGVGVSAFESVPLIGPIADNVSNRAISIGQQLEIYGTVLSEVLPNLVIYIWVIMIVSFAVRFVVAVVMAPLIPLSLLTHGGNGFFDSAPANNGIASLIGTAVQPFLMLIGLVASIVITYIGATLLNVILWATTSFSDISSLGFHQTVGLIIFYVVASIGIVIYSFYTAARIPGMIIDWYHGSMADRNADDARGADGIQSNTAAADGAAESAGSISTSGAGNSMKAARAAKAARGAK